MNLHQSKIVLLLILLFCSCQENSKIKEKSIKKDAIIEQEDATEIKTVTKKSELSILFESIDLNKLKIEYGKNSTSGIVSKKRNFHYKTTNDSSFLGVYFFPNEKEEDKYPVDLKLIIESTSTDWRFSDKDEQLVELTNYSKHVKILPINVGDSIAFIKQHFTIPLEKLDSDIYYLLDSVGTILSMKVKDDVIYKIRIGRYQFTNIEEINNILVSTFKH
jgi:hypothetical protein